MRVKKLMELLSKQDPESEVLTYVEEAEEYGETTDVTGYEVEEQEKLPYAKGDVPELKGRTVLISGWIAL